MTPRMATAVAYKAQAIESRGPPTTTAIVTSALVDVGAVLHRQCEDLNRLYRNSVTFTCSADEVCLPRIMASQVLWAARQLITDAYRGFTDGQHGYIAVASHLTGDSVELVVEYERPVTASTDEWMENDPTLLRNTVKQFGGRVEIHELVGGGRTMVQIPLQRH